MPGSVLPAWHGASSALTVSWTLVAALGLAITLGLLWDTVLDRRALHRDASYRRAGPRAIIARGHIGGHLLRAGALALFCAIGLIALYAPAPARAPPPSATQVVYTAALLGAELLLVAEGILLRATRRMVAATWAAYNEDAGYPLATGGD